VRFIKAHLLSLAPVARDGKLIKMGGILDVINWLQIVVQFRLSSRNVKIKLRNRKLQSVRFEDIPAVKLMIQVFRDMMPCI